MTTALIITAAGINCDLELARAFELAGATVRSEHLNTLIAEPSIVDHCQLIGLPGGFSFGDAIAAGRIMAQLMRQHLYGSLVSAIQRGVPIIAPCNGFQIAVQMGLLPGPAPGEAWPETPPSPTFTLGHNASARFIDRWTGVEFVSDSRCVWTHGMDPAVHASTLPIAHGEGRFTPARDEQIDALADAGQIALRYAAGENPNGSAGDVAGICDATGLVFGLMPHPERFTRWTHHPWWTRLAACDMAGDPPGLVMFRNAVRHARAAVTV